MIPLVAAGNRDYAVKGVHGRRLGHAAEREETFYNYVRSLGSGGRLVLRLMRKGVELSKTVQLPKLSNPFRKPIF